MTDVYRLCWHCHKPAKTVEEDGEPCCYRAFKDEIMQELAVVYSKQKESN